MRGLRWIVSSASEMDAARDTRPLRACFVAEDGGVVEMKMLFSSPSPCV